MADVWYKPANADEKQKEFNQYVSNNPNAGTTAINTMAGSVGLPKIVGDVDLVEKRNREESQKRALTGGADWDREVAESKPVENQSPVQSTIAPTNPLAKQAAAQAAGAFNEDGTVYTPSKPAPTAVKTTTEVVPTSAVDMPVAPTKTFTPTNINGVYQGISEKGNPSFGDKAFVDSLATNKSAGVSKGTVSNMGSSAISSTEPTSQQETPWQSMVGYQPANIQSNVTPTREANESIQNQIAQARNTIATGNASSGQDRIAMKYAQKFLDSMMDNDVKGKLATQLTQDSQGQKDFSQRRENVMEGWKSMLASEKADKQLAQSGEQASNELGYKYDALKASPKTPAYQMKALDTYDKEGTKTGQRDVVFNQFTGETLDDGRKQQAVANAKAQYDAAIATGDTAKALEIANDLKGAK